MPHITASNYFSIIGNYEKLIKSDADLLAAWEYFNKITKSGRQTEILSENPEVAETFELFLDNLNMEISRIRPSEDKKVKTPKVKAGIAAHKQALKQEPKSKEQQATKSKINNRPVVKKARRDDTEIVAHIPSAVGLARRYVSLHGKEKTYEQLLAIWRAFSKAIVERKVTKASPYKQEIEAMAAQLQAAVDQARDTGSLRLQLNEEKLKRYTEIATCVERAGSVALLTEYINIAGKPGMGERADKLLKRIDKADASGKLDHDPFATLVKQVKPTLQAYMDKEQERIELTDYVLSGLGSVGVYGVMDDGLSGYSEAQPVRALLRASGINGLGDKGLDHAFAYTAAPKLCKCMAMYLASKRKGATSKAPGSKYDLDTEIMDMRLRTAVKPADRSFIRQGLGAIEMQSVKQDPIQIVSAMELARMKFRTIGLKGKYRQLIGDPEPGFSMMIYGKPKGGKSTLAIDLAKELTALGRVMYSAYEEGPGSTLQDKVLRNGAAIPGLDFANRIPDQLGQYSFVFIDSISDARMGEQELQQMIKAHKPVGRSVIGIFHANKDGSFKGSQAFAHHVDILLSIDNGKVYAKGRYHPPVAMDLSELLPPSLISAA